MINDFELVSEALNDGRDVRVKNLVTVASEEFTLREGSHGRVLEFWKQQDKYYAIVNIAPYGMPQLLYAEEGPFRVQDLEVVLIQNPSHLDDARAQGVKHL